MGTIYDAGVVGMVMKGTHSTSISYERLNVVHNTEKSKLYVAKKDVPEGILLTNTTYWEECVGFDTYAFTPLLSLLPLPKAHTDISNWEEITGLTEDINCVAYGNDRFIAVGDNGKIYKSSDASTWEAITGFTEDFNVVCYGNGAWVIFGNGFGYVSTNNGNSWSSISGDITNENIISITFGELKLPPYGEKTKVFVAASNHKVYISTNGTEWTLYEEINSHNLTAICLDLYARCVIYAADDGWTNWNGIVIYLEHNDKVTSLVTAQVGYFYYTVFACESGRIYVGEEGRYSEVISLSPLIFEFSSLCYHDGIFIAVGTDFANPRVYYSYDGFNWEFKYIGPQRPKTVCFGDGKFVILGDYSVGGSNGIYSTKVTKQFVLETDSADTYSWKEVTE